VGRRVGRWQACRLSWALALGQDRAGQGCRGQTVASQDRAGRRLSHGCVSRAVCMRVCESRDTRAGLWPETGLLGRAGLNWSLCFA
jgi:hypothetical protein